MEETLHLTVDKTVSPVILPVRKVPLAVKEIERLVAQEILKPVDTPTDWVSSMVVVMKSNGKIRLCIDPKPLNQALKRNHYPLPVIGKIRLCIVMAKYVCVLIQSL